MFKAASFHHIFFRYNRKRHFTKEIITPSFWATWWFRALSIITIVALALVVYRYRMDQTILQRKELEHQIELRTAEILKQPLEPLRFEELVKSLKSIRFNWTKWMPKQYRLLDKRKYGRQRKEKCRACIFGCPPPKFSHHGSEFLSQCINPCTGRNSLLLLAWRDGILKYFI